MKVVITAGGKGERLKPLTNELPKPMVQVQNKPLLEHIIEYLKKYNFKDLIITACYKGASIKEYFGDGSGLKVKIDYTWEDESNPLGTAGSVGLARDRLNETFMVICGDALRSLDPNLVLSAHKRNRAFATMSLHKPQKNETPTSLVQFNSEKKVQGFIERPSLEQLHNESELYMNSSLYVFEPGIFKYIPKNMKVDFGYDVWPKVLADKKRVIAYPSDDNVLDVGTFDRLEKAQKWNFT